MPVSVQAMCRPQACRRAAETSPCGLVRRHPRYRPSLSQSPDGPGGVFSIFSSSEIQNEMDWCGLTDGELEKSASTTPSNRFV